MRVDASLPNIADQTDSVLLQGKDPSMNQLNAPVSFTVIVHFYYRILVNTCLKQQQRTVCLIVYLANQFLSLKKIVVTDICFFNQDS